MKRKVYGSSFAKQILLMVGLVSLSLLVASPAHAKGPGSLAGKPALVIVSLAGNGGINIKNEAELKARVLFLAEHNPKAVKVSSKGCGCPFVPDTSGGFWSCLKRCMSDVGVSPYSMIMCGAACAFAETPPGAIICAICIGASVTVIETCALGCASIGGRGIGQIMEARNLKQRHGSSGALPTKLRLQPAKS